MSTEPQQDRNVEVKQSFVGLVNCRRCGSPPKVVYDMGGVSVKCSNTDCESKQPSVTVDDAAKHWNETNRPSQPPQKVEAGDAVKGVVEEIEELKRMRDDRNRVGPDIGTLAACILFSDHLHHELSARSVKFDGCSECGAEACRSQRFKNFDKIRLCGNCLTKVAKASPLPEHPIESPEMLCDFNATGDDAKGVDGECVTLDRANKPITADGVTVSRGKTVYIINDIATEIIELAVGSDPTMCYEKGLVDISRNSYVTACTYSNRIALRKAIIAASANAERLGALWTLIANIREPIKKCFLDRTMMFTDFVDVAVKWSRSVTGEGHPDYLAERLKVAEGLLRRLTDGMKWWADQEDGIPDECWEAYSDAKFIITGKRPVAKDDAHAQTPGDERQGCK